MTNDEARQIYGRYLDAWHSTDLAQRRAIADKILLEGIEYHTVRHDWCTGRSQVIEDMATFHERFPGGHFEIGPVSTHHRVALLTWIIIQANGTEFARGHDQLTVDDAGRIARIITFGPSSNAD